MARLRSPAGRSASNSSPPGLECGTRLSPTDRCGIFSPTVFEDITKRKQGEATLKKLNEDLEFRVAERTRELAGFIEKLQLRAIDGFSRLFIEKYQDLVDEKGVDYPYNGTYEHAFRML